MFPSIATIVLYELLESFGDYEDLDSADEAEIEALEDCGF